MTVKSRLTWLDKNSLYNKYRNRYLIPKGAKPVTICIAAICDMFSDVSPKIILCADRAVSTNIQFEGAEPKIRRIKPWCYIMQSSNNSIASDLILERVLAKAQLGKYETILSITELLRDECVTYKTECIERDVLSKYQVVIGKLGASPDSVVKLVKDDINQYLTAQFDFRADFVVAGIEPNKQAHIYLVNQNGEYYLGDSLGYLTVGSGSDLAFLQMTRYVYPVSMPMIPAIALVYVAKRISERAIGVGRQTDFYILHSPETEPFNPQLYNLVNKQECMKELDNTFNAIDRQERRLIDRGCKKINDYFAKAKEAK